MSEPDVPELHVGIQVGVSHREIRTSEPVVLIGRGAPDQESGPTVDLAQDDSVSRRHAEIRRLRDGYTVTDLDSTNGTWVNGERIAPGEPVRVKDGDRIAVGRLSVLTLTVPPATVDKDVNADTS
ncbi:MAG: FHA domain-containing protein [Armatimonadetes bacterium]|nr:FHA domain-containing protein [Armatimonadota bacterium]